MKFKILLFALPLFISSLLTAQTMAPGMIVGEAGIGLGIYKVRLDYTFTGGGTISGKDTVGAFVLPITVDYGVHKLFSVGGTFKYSNYINGDSSNTQTYRSFDLSVRPAFHFVNRNRFNMNLYGLIGGSYISYNSNDQSNITGHGWGPTFGYGLDMRIYFSNVIGMNLTWNHTTYTYHDFEYTDNTGHFLTVDWSGSGFNLGIGLTFKLN